MKEGNCSGAVVSHPFCSQPFLHHPRLRYWDRGSRVGFPIPVHGVNKSSCCTLADRVPFLQPRPPPPLFLVPPPRRCSAVHPVRSSRLACSLANWSSAGSTTALIGAAVSALASVEVVRDTGAACFSLGGAYCLVLAFDNLTKRGLLEQALSRKLVHVLSGVLFLLTWPMFSSSPEARFFAAVVPFLNLLRLLAYGLALVKDEALIKSVTRYGRREELLRGPFYYVVVLLLAVLVFWRESPVGLAALCMMSGGDGFADIVGRRFGAVKLPFNKHKSWVGSFSMFFFGFAISLGMLYYYRALGFLPSLNWDGGAVALNVAFVALVATVVESLPLTDSIDDNVSVPLASILAAMVAFGS